MALSDRACIAGCVRAAPARRNLKPNGSGGLPEPLGLDSLRIYF